MQEEFEKLIGFRVNNQVYNDVIEPMYIASNLLNKGIFCKMFNKSFLKRVAGKGMVDSIVSIFVDMANNQEAYVKYGIMKQRYCEHGGYVYEVAILPTDVYRDAVLFGRKFTPTQYIQNVDIDNRARVVWLG